jgi:ribosomal protein L24
MPIHQSNVAIFNAATGKADRVGIKLLGTARRSASSSPAAKRSRPRLTVMAKTQAGGRGSRRRVQRARGARLTIYREKIVPELMAKFGYTSVMQVPRLTKITLNMGVSEAVSDKKVMDTPSAT